MKYIINLRKLTILNLPLDSDDYIPLLRSLINIKYLKYLHISNYESRKRYAYTYPLYGIVELSVTMDYIKHLEYLDLTRNELVTTDIYFLCKCLNVLHDLITLKLNCINIIFYYL